MTISREDAEFERAAAVIAVTLAEWHDDVHWVEYMPECRAVVQALLADGWKHD